MYDINGKRRDFAMATKKTAQNAVVIRSKKMGRNDGSRGGVARIANTFG